MDADVASSLSVLYAAGYSRLITWTATTVRFAVLLKRLSGRDDLALHAVRAAQVKDCAWKRGVAVDPTPRHLQQWSDELAHDAEILMCVACPASSLRQEAHKFLVESLVAERVQLLSEKGLLVPSSRVLQLYLSFFDKLPQAAGLAHELQRLQSTAWMQKRWSSRFRKTWSLTWGGAPAPHLIREATQKVRAGIFYRWLRHVLEQRLAGRGVVVVNMDETMLSNLRGWKKGVVANSAAANNERGSELRKDAAMSRTSLIASICSDGDLQKFLPQVRLPRSKDGAVPSKHVISAFAAAGAPQIAWHGGQGWNTTQTMVWYLRELCKSVRLHRPGFAVVLVLDCCSVHISAQVLATAKRLDMHIVVIPARMTWLVQPLDTCVFSVLKRAMRNFEFDAKAANQSGRLARLERVRVQGESVRAVLIRSEWSTSMRRSGMTVDFGPLRPSLQRVVEGVNLHPRPPSVAELSEILQVNEVRAMTLLPLLLPPPRRMPEVPSAAAAVENGGRAAVAMSQEPVHRQLAPVHLVRLASLPARPAAEAPAANVWLPSSLQGRPLTRSMSAAFAARAGARELPSAEPATAKRQRS